MDSEQLIKTIDQIYYRDEHSFNLDHLTDQLPDNLTSDYLIDYKNKLERLLTVVTRKVSELILSHQPTYVNELQRIADLQKSITESIRVCSQGRKCLSFVKDGNAKNGTTIVEHSRKRESLAKLLESLTAISEVKKSVIEIREFINSQEDFPRAIQMCREGKALLASYGKYKCICDIISKIDNTQNFIVSSLIQKLDQFANCQDFSQDQFNEFVRCLYNLEQIVHMGEYCGFNSKEELNTQVTAQALKFFNSFFHSTVEELKMFFENESWEMLPVRNDFKLVQLKEFAFLRTAQDDKFNMGQENEQEQFFANDQADQTDYNEFQHPTQPSTYFSILPLDKISLSSESDLDFELNKDEVDEDEESAIILKYTATPVHPDYRLTRPPGPVLTNSSLNVLRVAGRYIQLMNLLAPISYDILMKVYKLLDQYTLFVFRKFGPNDSDDRLGAVIASLRESLIGDQTGIEDASSMLTKHSAKETDEPLDPRKAVAIESLVFLVNQLWNLQEYLETLISPEQRDQLHKQFSSQNNSTVPDFLKARANIDAKKS